VPGLDGIVTPLAGPVMKGVLGPVVDIMGDILGPLLLAGFGEKTMAGLGTTLQRQIIERLIGNLTDYITPTTTVSMVDSLPEAAAEAIRDAVVVSCTDEITKQVTVKTLTFLNGELPPKVAGASLPNMAQSVVQDLGLVLPRALTHSIVGALAHTIKHNPSVDYYCYFCYKYGKYCQYCHHSTAQTYYSMYYAGYYSAYYSQYYVTQAAAQKQWEQRRVAKVALPPKRKPPPKEESSEVH